LPLIDSSDNRTGLQVHREQAITKHTHDNKVSQTVSFKQPINVNNEHIQ